jgi:hypothetical protein
MRGSLWLLGLAAGALASAGIAACSSSSTDVPASPDAATDTGSTCRVDASLTVFAASDAAGAGCAACVQANCLDRIQTCASDCACIALFDCVADSGAATGLTPAAVAATTACAGPNPASLLQDPGLNGLLSCFEGVCSDSCSTPSDAGRDAATDAAASPADASDAGSATDAAADAPPDDAAVSDAADSGG